MYHKTHGQKDRKELKAYSALQTFLTLAKGVLLGRHKEYCVLFYAVVVLFNCSIHCFLHVSSVSQLMPPPVKVCKWREGKIKLMQSCE